MATRDYWLRFGSGNPADKAGLAPTFITFVNGSGTDITPPSITEPKASSGLYKFAYDATQTIAFTCDGATTGLNSSDRYIVGVLDPQDLFGVTLNLVGTNLVNQGTTLVAFGNSFAALSSTFTAFGSTQSGIAATLSGVGNTVAGLGTDLTTINGLIGSTVASFGSTSADPSTLFGFLRRAQEFSEGDQVYTKATGILQFFSRGSGSSTLLRQKTVSDTATLTTKG